MLNLWTRTIIESERNKSTERSFEQPSKLIAIKPLKIRRNASEWKWGIKTVSYKPLGVSEIIKKRERSSLVRNAQ